MNGIEVHIDQAQALLANIIATGRNMTPITRALAGVLADIPERAFANQADPATGAPWAALSPTTVARRGSAQPILQVSGILAGSIHSEHGPDYARASTADVKAATHQFGAKKGQYGSTRKGTPIPWGDIPARPFFGIGPEDEAEIEGTALEALMRVLEGR
ncbi:MAG TPA: phage virion morphogenesis protein [Solidesulfovibrio magneticus]|nr:phage virion morphogenesis protein [Solidesulfovibrio magneticus]